MIESVLRKRAARNFFDKLIYNKKYPFDIIPRYMLKEAWQIIEKNNHPDYRIQFTQRNIVKFKR